MREYADFQEIAHCGGKATFTIASDADGQVSYQISFENSRPTPAEVVGIYAMAPQGISVADFRLGGIGEAFDPPMPENCIPVLLGSDTHTCWGHECRRCRGYFRNKHHTAVYPLTCPYCGLRQAAHHFLTAAQRKYIQHYVNTLILALQEEMAPHTEKQVVIDMDSIVDQSKDAPRPDFYYAAITQQTRFKCEKCDEFNDIRGRYGYCAACGWRNNSSQLRMEFDRLRNELNENKITPENAVRSAVSNFDACCRNYAAQLARRIPMKPTRRTNLERLLFHDTESAAIEWMRSAFDIDLLRGVSNPLFIKKMMHRRHIFEHNGGVADKKYVKESGDAEAQEGMLIRENTANAHDLISGLMKMTENFDADFHEIFRPTQWPITYFQERKARMRQRRGEPTSGPQST